MTSNRLFRVRKLIHNRLVLVGIFVLPTSPLTRVRSTNRAISANKFGADGGNRTRVISLEGWSNTIIRHPRNLFRLPNYLENGGGRRIRTFEG
jgi:hypothetical protein